MEQQQRQELHGIVRQAIERVTTDPSAGRLARNLLCIDSRGGQIIDQHSLQYMVDFLDNHHGVVHEVTGLNLHSVQLVSHPPSFNVMSNFFARSDTTLTKVGLHYCNFGSQQDASRLLAAFERNTSVFDLTIRLISNLRGAALGNSLSGLIQNMPQLQRLQCSQSHLGVEGVRPFQPALQANRTLKTLILADCELGDEGIRLIADAFVGNTTIDKLNIEGNAITFAGLADITRLMESTRLKTIYIGGNYRLFDNEDATEQFVSTLQHKNSSVQELLDIGQCNFPGDEDSKSATLANINNSLTRNQQLNHCSLLLAPPPPQQQQRIDTRTTALMMFKTWHKAITKFAMVPNNAGASAIFKLFTSRPQLLEKRLKRPLAAAAAAAVSHGPQNGGGGASSINNTSNNPAATDSSSSASTIISRPQKRQRL